MHINVILQNSYFIDSFRYKGLTGIVCCFLNVCFCLVAGVTAKVCRYILRGQ